MIINFFIVLSIFGCFNIFVDCRVLFTEIYYKTDRQTQTEFVELYNDGDSASSLDGYEITGGIKYKFENISIKLRN